MAGNKHPSSVPSVEDQKQEKAVTNQQQQYNDPKIHAFVQRNTQSLVSEFNLRTVPVTISSAFPTLNGVKEAISLAKRAGLKEGQLGDGVVIGVGCGAAIDLAKAVSDTLFGNVGASHSEDGTDNSGGRLILAPSTLGGLWAASSSSPSLLLDTKEEMILPYLTAAWRATTDGMCRRRSTIVTLDPSPQLAFPPLYSAPRSIRQMNVAAVPSMAQFAAASLAIVLDVARSIDTAGETTKQTELEESVVNEMKTIASLCVSVLNLASEVSQINDESSDEASTKQDLAQQQILEAIVRLSPLIEQSALLTQTSVLTTGTIPQKLANALLPTYFPQCHLVTYFACILPGLCDVLDTGASGGAVEEVTRAILKDKNNSLSLWAFEITNTAGIPTMASLAFGTPNLKALNGSVDAYETLIASDMGGFGGIGGHDESFVMEDILQRCLNK